MWRRFCVLLKCPQCKRESTYHAKFDQCSGCGRGYEPKPSAVMPTHTGTNDVVGAAIVTLTPGEPCPACGKPVGKKPAQLQREYRERKKEANQ